MIQRTYTYRKLKGRIVEKYGSQKNFAEAIHISENALSRKMSGKTGLSQADIAEWIELLDIDKDAIGEYFFN